MGALRRARRVDTVDGGEAGEYRVRVPLEDQRQSFRDVNREATLTALEKFTSEQRRQRYEELELMVTALSKEELSVSGVFDAETVHISEPSSGLPTRYGNHKQYSRSRELLGNSAS